MNISAYLICIAVLGMENHSHANQSVIQCITKLYEMSVKSHTIQRALFSEVQFPHPINDA